MKITKKFFIFCLLTVGLLLARSALAANFSFSTDGKDLYIGDQFEVRVSIDTQGEDINAIEGKIDFPADSLQLLDVKTGNSLINFWIEKPDASSLATGQLIFSGMTPNGFNTKSGYLFSMIFQTVRGGNDTLSFSEVKALKNDGLGTEAGVIVSPFQFDVQSLARRGGPLLYSPAVDSEPPEPFYPQISRDPNIYANKYFLTFSAQDKNSGIDHYEVREQKTYQLGIYKFQTGDWKIATSPHLLHDQRLVSLIEIKAVDRAGNEEAVQLPPTNDMAWYEKNILWCAIGLASLFVFLLFSWMANKKRRKP